MFCCISGHEGLTVMGFHYAIIVGSGSSKSRCDRDEECKVYKVTEFGFKLHGVSCVFNIHKYLHNNSYKMSRGHFVILKQLSL